jgi:hypothetical protein
MEIEGKLAGNFMNALRGGMDHRKVLLSFEIAIGSRQFIVLFIFVLFERNQTQMCCHRSVIRSVGLVIVEGFPTSKLGAWALSECSFWLKDLFIV